MALRLLDAGHPLCVFDASEEAMRPLVARGAKAMSSAQELGSTADVVCMSLPTPGIVQAVALGERGIVRGSRAKVLIDVSTTGPTVARLIAGAAGDRGIAWVDSPVSGGIAGARAGTLAVMVSCGKDTYPRVEPLLFGFVVERGEQLVNPPVHADFMFQRAREDVLDHLRVQRGADSRDEE